MTRNIDNEAGGAADLQTDVMRFMAILSLCLVAIFALVQSLPLEQTESTAAEVPVPKTQPERQVPVEKPRPAAGKLVRKDPLPPPPALPQSRPAPPEVLPPPEPEGFTLRFESDQALTRLVSQNEIGLYAISPGQSLRMTINRDKAEFWNASPPKQYHEMDTSTVPKAVVDALNLSHNPADGPSVWGVTLPATMTASLDEFMRASGGGSLVIGADGRLRLEN